MFYSSVTLNVRLPDFDIHAINTSVITLATVQTLATLHGSFDTSLTVITTLAAMFTILTHDSEGTQQDSQLIRLDRPRNEHMPPSTTQQLRNERTPSGAITHFTRAVSHFGLFSRSETVIRHSPLTPSIALSADFMAAYACISITAHGNISFSMVALNIKNRSTFSIYTQNASHNTDTVSKYYVKYIYIMFLLKK